MKRFVLALCFLVSATLSACQPAAKSGKLRVIAAETFLADIAQNVAGDRLTVDALMPIGLDPHGFEPTPKDIARVSEADIIILNGRGIEASIQQYVDSAKSAGQTVIVATEGLTSRPTAQHEGEEGDPHFWLDPNEVIHYVENIRDGLAAADPDGAGQYAQNAAAYIVKLQELDGWIREQVAQIPTENRQIVTNHESLGYFADEYGFTIADTIVPNVSPTTSPSAQELAALIEHIRQNKVRAIFLETGSNPQLANQVASETGIKVVSTLYSHSVSAANGPAPTYIDMVRYNTRAIVDALK